MNKKLEIQEIAIALFARKHNPALLTPNFLKANGIIPVDWVLAKPPICTDVKSEIVFENGVSIVARVDRVLFCEPLKEKNDWDVNIARLTCQYLRTFPTLDYCAVAINPRGYVAFGSKQAVDNYSGFAQIPAEKLQEFGQFPERGGVNLVYSLAGRLFNLSINPAVLDLPEERNLSVVIFSSNFHYNLASDRKLQQLDGIIGNWQWDVKTYQQIVETGCMQLGSILDLERRLQNVDEGYYREGMAVANCL